MKQKNMAMATDHAFLFETLYPWLLWRMSFWFSFHSHEHSIFTLVFLILLCPAFISGVPQPGSRPFLFTLCSWTSSSIIRGFTLRSYLPHGQPPSLHLQPGSRFWNPDLSIQWSTLLLSSFTGISNSTPVQTGIIHPPHSQLCPRSPQAERETISFLQQDLNRCWKHQFLKCICHLNMKTDHFQNWVTINVFHHIFS